MVPDQDIEERQFVSLKKKTLRCCISSSLVVAILARGIDNVEQVHTISSVKTKSLVLSVLRLQMENSLNLIGNESTSTISIDPTVAAKWV